MHKPDPDGPLKWPSRPPDTETAVIVAEKLRGHVTSTRYLPAGLSPAIDAVRGELLRVRSRVAEDIDRLGDLLATYAAEDAGHTAALRAAHRAGVPGPEDKRTPPERREAERQTIAESMWAGARVLAEIVDQARAALRDEGEQLLGDLRATVAVAQERREAAQRALDEAARLEWLALRRGNWLQNELDRGAFGTAFSGQPAPEQDEEIPPGVDPALVLHKLKTATTRPWWRAQEAAA